MSLLKETENITHSRGRMTVDTTFISDPEKVGAIILKFRYSVLYTCDDRPTAILLYLYYSSG